MRGPARRRTGRDRATRRAGCASTRPSRRPRPRPAPMSRSRGAPNRQPAFPLVPSIRPVRSQRVVEHPGGPCTCACGGGCKCRGGAPGHAARLNGTGAGVPGPPGRVGHRRRRHTRPHRKHGATARGATWLPHSVQRQPVTIIPPSFGPAAAASPYLRPGGRRSRPGSGRLAHRGLVRQAPGPVARQAPNCRGRASSPRPASPSAS